MERSELIAPAASVRERIERQIAKGKELLDRKAWTDEDLQQLKHDHKNWDDFNQELLRFAFSTDKECQEYSRRTPAPVAWFAMPSLDERLQTEKKVVSARIAGLESVVAKLELYESRAAATAALSGGGRPSEDTAADFSRVFIVHGHDIGARDAVARVLGQLGIEAVVLSEQASGGRTVIEKLEHHSEVPYTIALLTPDDEGRALSESTPKPRARQNVILELGYFVGKLGRRGMCALHKGNVEIPSDYHGVVYVSMDEADWKFRIAAELRQAGYAVDLNRLG